MRKDHSERNSPVGGEDRADSDALSLRINPSPELISTDARARIGADIGNRESQYSFSEGLRSAYEQIVAQGDFALVDLPFSESEVTLLRNLRVVEDTDC